jgi:arsenate reductase (thioredoxin)
VWSVSTPVVLFVCLHGSAKSLIAAEHLNRLAKSRGLTVRGESAGIEPDASVPPTVVAGLAADGIDVHGYTPRRFNPESAPSTIRIVNMGCDAPSLEAGQEIVERWDDLPMVSDGYDAARQAIVNRVERLLTTLGAMR